MSYARYLWGRSKVDKAKFRDYIDFDPQTTAPPVSRGRVYLDEKYMLHTCADGSTWATIWQIIATSNPPYRRKGAMFMDADYKLRICEDGSTFKTVTTGEVD